ncbi:OmpA family protein [Flavobacterium sp. GA093]|uniref:OmpA family protein n=1 Tax=Flavobacterium hydrocarbonoxydans TaxID=2683249 RepID=A0A6I4NWC6_9FLAO|nr:OmpA family protein [Flavobacterium hydrocarbonoxydans]MWB96785.1 OmpA family protein [Flavobacterium hydrocarbonoxydans]
MKKLIFLYLIYVSLFSYRSYSQQATINSGDKKYDKYAFIDAIKTYERVANKGYKSEEMFKKLGNSYYFNSKFENAAKWYSELYAMSNNLEAEYYYRYAQSLKSIGETDKANKILEEFYAKDKKDSRGKLFKMDENYISQIKNNSGRYKIEDAGVNSPYSDYGSFKYRDKLYFTSARDTGSLNQRRHKWTGEYFTNFYVAELDSVGVAKGNIEKFDNNINSKFHESSPAFTRDGKTVYFTRNNYLDGKKGANSKKTTLLKIYSATLEDGKWTNVSELPFDSDSYSTAHPAISPDGKTLFFASDMPGTIGQSDIFKVNIDDNGSFGPVVNLGPGINTEGKESFPYVTDENIIYFASDGHPGIGGFDVFAGNLNPEGGVSNIQNLGADINSPKDDFAYFFDPISRRGYFSSNKDGGKGSDDIYTFLETRKLSCEQLLYGLITDAETGAVLPGAKVSLYDKNLSLLNSTLADATGNYTLMVNCGQTYNVRVEMPEYSPKEQNIQILYENGKTVLSFALEKASCKVAIGNDLGKCFGIKVIYFDLDKSYITEAAAYDLEKILDVLQQNPTMKLDIRSHTDSRQTSQYNQILSDKRATATINWLVKNGIDRNRLTGKGYGENQLINRCADGIECTEEEHKENRRSEFIVTEI